MSKYSLILSKIISPTTKIKVFELLVNGESLIQKFSLKVEKDGNLIKSLVTAFKTIEHSCNDFRLPSNKWKVISDSKLPCKLYEAKKGDIRVYLFQDTTGRVIVSGGLKGNQKKDIARIKKIITDYFNQKSYE